MPQALATRVVLVLDQQVVSINDTEALQSQISAVTDFGTLFCGPMWHVRFRMTLDMSQAVLVCRTVTNTGMRNLFCGMCVFARHWT